MPSTATTRNRLEMQEPGENSNTWGTRLNANMIDLVDAAMDGMEALTVSGPVTLTANDYAADQARKRYLNCIGTGGTITIPNVEKIYIVRNATSGTLTFTTGTGTSATVAAGANAIIVGEGGDVVRNLSDSLGALTVTSLSVGGIEAMLKTLNPGGINSNLTLTPSDNGRFRRVIGATNRTFTIAPESSGAWPSGAFVIIAPSGGGTLTVARGAGVELYYSGSDANRTISATGFGIVIRGNTDEWYLIGAGVT